MSEPSPLNRPVEVRGSYATPDPTQHVAVRPSDVLAALDDDATAQDVIDALRIALMAQHDPVKVDRLVRMLVDLAPETDSNRGIDLLLSLIAEATVRVEVAT